MEIYDDIESVDEAADGSNHYAIDTDIYKEEKNELEPAENLLAEEEEKNIESLLIRKAQKIVPTCGRDSLPFYRTGFHM